MEHQIDLTAFTHYLPLDTGYFKVFVMDECETCGGPLAAANAMSILPRGENPESILVWHGLKRVDTHPADGYYDDETDMEVCDNCAT